METTARVERARNAFAERRIPVLLRRHGAFAENRTLFLQFKRLVLFLISFERMAPGCGFEPQSIGSKPIILPVERSRYGTSAES